jgi:hypothetical protein
MNISITIEQLILEGLPLTRGQGPLVQAAFERELGRLLAERGVATALLHGGALRSLGAGPVQIAGGSDPANIGQQIAQAVYAGMGPEEH